MELARLPQTVRGFGHVKERHAQAAQVKQQRLLEELHNDTTALKAAGGSL